MTNPKPWYASKTVWFNAVMTIILVAELLPQVVPNIPPAARTVSLVVFGVGNIVLRVWFTDAPIETARR